MMLQCPVSRNFAVNATYPGPVVFQASPFLKGGDLEKRLFSGVHVHTYTNNATFHGQYANTNTCQKHY